jgi:DNA-binding Lrp family transcriptional regulator
VSSWYFFTNHAHVLTVIADDPDLRLRDIGDEVGITERAAHRIVTDLVRSGYVSRQRVGARNRYQVHTDVLLRHHVHEGLTVGELIGVFAGKNRTQPRDLQARHNLKSTP